MTTYKLYRRDSSVFIIAEDLIPKKLEHLHVGHPCTPCDIYESDLEAALSEKGIPVTNCIISHGGSIGIGNDLGKLKNVFVEPRLISFAKESHLYEIPSGFEVKIEIPYCKRDNAAMGVDKKCGVGQFDGCNCEVATILPIESEQKPADKITVQSNSVGQSAEEEQDKLLEAMKEEFYQEALRDGYSKSDAANIHYIAEKVLDKSKYKITRIK